MKDEINNLLLTEKYLSITLLVKKLNYGFAKSAKTIKELQNKNLISHTFEGKKGYRVL